MVKHGPAKAGSGNRLGSSSLSPPAYDAATSLYKVRGTVRYHGIFSEMEVEIQVSACDMNEALCDVEYEFDIAFRRWEWVGKPGVELIEDCYR